MRYKLFYFALIRKHILKKLLHDGIQLWEMRMSCNGCISIWLFVCFFCLLCFSFVKRDGGTLCSLWLLLFFPMFGILLLPIIRFCIIGLRIEPRLFRSVVFSWPCWVWCHWKRWEANWKHCQAFYVFRNTGKIKVNDCNPMFYILFKWMLRICAFISFCVN